MRIIVAILIGFVAIPAYSADESWRLPLAEKEKILEKNNVERHNILGLYPSQVDVPFDDTTLGYANIAHAVCWSANYLAGASYRYAFLKKSGAPAKEVAAAKARADELFEGVYRCQLVTGVRGLQARGYAIGHGETYEERWGDPNSDNWHQGAGEYSNLRWRGSPSHHNYSDVTHALCQYYDLAAEDIQKDRCREAIDALVGYWVDNDLKIIHYDKKHNTPILGFTDGKTINMRVMMAIAGAKVGYHATGDAKYKAVYDKLIEQYSVRGLKPFKTEKDFDDAEHVFCHLENLFRIEDDPELRAAYRVILDALWDNHKNDAQTLFTYIYMSVTPDAPDHEKALKEGLYSLQTYPTDTIFKPTMSSLRTDLKPPYPVYAACWDNEYIWKGCLLNPDGWFSRVITDVAVPAEDPAVIYAIDTKGEVYQSRDGAATAEQWRLIRPGDTGLSPTRSIHAGPRIRMIFLACDDGFHASTSGGYAWVRMPVPEEGGRAVEMMADPVEPNTIYAVRENAVYKSADRRARNFGKKWELLADGLPAGVKVAPKTLYKVYENGAAKSTDGGASWQTTSTTGLDIPIVKTVFASASTDWVFAGTPAGLYISKDGGDTWASGNLVLQFEHNERRDLGGAAFIDAYWRGCYYGFIDKATANAPWSEQ